MNRRRTGTPDSRLKLDPPDQRTTRSRSSPSTSTHSSSVNPSMGVSLWYRCAFGIRDDTRGTLSGMVRAVSLQLSVLWILDNDPSRIHMNPSPKRYEQLVVRIFLERDSYGGWGYGGLCQHNVYFRAFQGQPCLGLKGKSQLQKRKKL